LGNYSSGHLYVFDGDVLREMSLPRTIENPDGIAFTDNGSLIVPEGAVNSGNGKVLDSGFMALRLDPSVYPPRSRTAANPHHNAE
jgi:hypothetical protein